METTRLVALAIFASYFLLVLGLFALIVKSLPSKNVSAGRRPGKLLFTGLTLASFTHTWFYMFKFMHWSFTTYEESTRATTASSSLLVRITDWLVETRLFEQAWAAVSFGQANWWWSEQLCLFTVGFWTAFLYLEGKRYGIPNVWAYMLLGQVVAISVASNLFYLAIVLSPKPSQRAERAPAVLWITTLLALGSVARSPYTDEHTFLANLLVMHSMIILPLIFPSSSSRLSIPTSALFGFYALASLVMRVRTTYLLEGGLWEALHSHPAQSSIGYDVIWTTISWTAWALHEGGHSLTEVMVAPLLSVGVVAPWAHRRDSSDA